MATPLEADVLDIARVLADGSTEKSSGVYSMSFWNEKLLSWAMARPEFKERLFRFVDVFPATSSNRDVLAHVKEYLDADGVPKPLRRAISVAGALPFGAFITANQARRNIRRMADQFILGSTADQAVKEARKLWDQGKTVTVDLLGEKTVTEPEADAYAARVMTILDALGMASKSWPRRENEPDARVSISIKPTAMASRYHPLTRQDGLRQAADRIRPILKRAHQLKVFVWFDMEHHDVKDLTIALFQLLLDEPQFAEARAGLVMQAYLRETYADLGHVISWSGGRRKPIAIRLVKGAYWDTETIHAQTNDWPVPVYQVKAESDANYERCTTLLLENHDKVHSAFASHNLRSLAYAIACARANGLGDGDFEVQMLYGMAEPMHEAVRAMGLNLRVYAPVGEMVPGMSYLVRRLLENTSNESFVRLRFAEGRELAELVAPPRAAVLEPELEAFRPGSSFGQLKAYLPEPPAQWHRDEVRQKMADALAALDHKLVAGPALVPARIAGRSVKTETLIESLDPTTPSVVVAHSASCTAADVDTAMTAADAAQPAWAAKLPEERAAVLFGAALYLRRRRYQIAALEVREAGKPWAEADGDVCEAIDFCEYYGREALRLAAGGAVQSTAGESNMLAYQARGVGAVIAPWNFPLAIPTGMTVAALVMGNAVILKPAEQTPRIAEVLVEALETAGLPAGVLQFLPGDGEDVGAALVAHRDISFVVFTGSKPVGLSILEAAAKVLPGQRQIKRTIVELGGKNPAIVDSDADLDSVVPAVMYSAFGFSGQKCSALSRLIVLDSAYDALLERLVGAVGALRIGDPSDMGTDVGPVIEQAAQSRIKATIAAAFTQGAMAASRTDLPADGYFVGPTIITDTKADAVVARDEIFGPVLTVFRAKNIDEALAIANDTDFALTAGIFSRTPSHIARLSKELRAGNVYVNRTTTGAVVGRQPFGGFGLSGGGTKAGGPDYLLQFVDSRVITENTVRQGFAATHG